VVTQTFLGDPGKTSKYVHHIPIVVSKPSVTANTNTRSHSSSSGLVRRSSRLGGAVVVAPVAAGPDVSSDRAAGSSDKLGGVLRVLGDGLRVFVGGRLEPR